MWEQLKGVRDYKKMNEAQTILYLRFLQNDINVLLRTNEDNLKLCELRQKRDVILSKF